jgi:SAM-dependent MidA family methyltransferase
LARTDAAPSPPSEEALAHSRSLIEVIAREIARAGGWVSFARYMELALYAPGLGYYTGGSTKLGGAGDFVTAPELSSLFSQTLARQVGEIQAAVGGEVLELGAGSGRMAADLLLALDAVQRLPAGYAILEVSAQLRERQQQRLEALPGRIRERVRWLDTLPGAWTGSVIANEVLDALPVHLTVWGEPPSERGVTLVDGRFAYQDRALEPGLLRSAAARIDAAPGYVSEICLAAPALVDALAAMLRHGVLLFIDYGFGRREYYHPQRTQGTLMCHYRHRAHDDPFLLPGLQDITAHVDFTAVAEAGVGAGLQLAGYTTQAHFLVNLGITDLLGRSPSDDPSYFPTVAGAQKLLSPAEMGELFKTIALLRGPLPPLSGFARGDLSRLL